VDAFYCIVQDAELVAAAADDLCWLVMSSTISKWSRLTVPDIIWAAEDEVQGIGYSNLEFYWIIHHVISMLKMHQGNVFSANRLRDMMWGRIIIWSLPSLLLCITISADNEHMLDAMMGPEAVCKFSNMNSWSAFANRSKLGPFLLARMLSMCAHCHSRNGGGSPGIQMVRRWSCRHVWESPRLFGISDIKGSRESNNELGSVAD
jgi:hypothetical protein